MNRRGPRDFDRRLWRRFWNIAKRYFTSEEKWRAQIFRPTPDAELHEVLELVNLPQLVQRCGGFDVELDFGKLL